MMSADRSVLSRSAVLFLFVLLGTPIAARSATLEDSAKELALEIAAELPAREAITCEFRNNSSLQPEEVARVEQALRAELQRRDIPLAGDGAATTVSVTLSENWKELVWTGEIRRADASQVVFVAVPRAGRSQFVSNAMHVTVRGEKFWEGQEEILDAAEGSSGNGKSWLVLLLPTRLIIQDLQTGSIAKVDIVPAPANRRDPWGQLGVGLGQPGSVIWFAAGALVCKVDLDDARFRRNARRRKNPKSRLRPGLP